MPAEAAAVVGVANGGKAASNVTVKSIGSYMAFASPPLSPLILIITHL